MARTLAPQRLFSILSQSARPSLVHSPFRLNSLLRTMSTQKQQWLVIIPDHEGALKARMDVRPQHLSSLTPQVEAGFWQLGGATLASPIVEGEPAQINGSCMLAVAESKEEVIEALKKDVYYTNKVWDWEKVQIWPFRSAFIKP